MKGLKKIREFIEKSKIINEDYKIWKIFNETNGINETDKISRTTLKNPEDLIKGLPIKVGKGSWQGIVFEEDIQIEFGNKKKPSLATVFCTTDPLKVNNGRISLIGPDIKDITIPASSFGLIVIIGGNKIISNDLIKIKNILAISNTIEGFALKSIPRKWWFRLNKESYKAGISFEHIGRAIFYLYLENFPDLIESIEIIFITNSHKAVNELIEIEKIIAPYFKNAIQNKILKYVDKYQKIREDCDLEEECDICDNQIICEQIIDIIKKREVNKNKN